VSVSIPPGQKISFSARLNGIPYQLSGFTEVFAGEPKTITGGGGVARSRDRERQPIARRVDAVHT
jgi:hypothetical protein